jgi:hypothetical protein
MQLRLVVGLLGAAVCWAQPVPLKIYENTLDNWQAKTGMRIDSGARRKILDDVQASQLRVRDSFAASHLQNYATINQQLVRQYCFDQRDKKLAGAPVEKAKLTKEDVTRWSFIDFLTDFLSGQPRQKVGYLEVQSGKTGAEILIDSERKGYTNRSFVMSVGTYTVNIKHPTLACNTFEVSIRDGATETIQCPAK